MDKGGGIVTQPGSNLGIQLQENRIDFLQQQIFEDNTGRSSSVTFDASGQGITNTRVADNNTQYIQTIVCAPDDKQDNPAYQYVIDFANIKQDTSTHTQVGGQITIRSELPQNSDPEQYPLGISFVDTTIDPENPGKIYKLSDFALKTDIPSGLDLTNYQGEWNLVSNRSSNEPNYSTTVTISSFGNSDYVLSQLPEEGKDLYKGLYISCKTLREDTYEKETFISSLFGVTDLYDIAKNTNTNEVDLLNANFNAGGTPSFTLEHQRGLSFGDPMYYTRLEYGTLSVASGSYTYGIHLTCKDINKDTNESVYARFGVDTGTNHNGKAEIYFQQSNINNNERITLESILNRITALEQALAEKANTANPAFTGKVSINSQA